ncbi:MAG: flagellar hook-basal body complex protein [Ruminococcaceae bacterium]|nr:flagellar hook-basal body complex protein [Oscillospiraceae bacterium]
MNRALFSGVAGLKTHQTKMDVIGNNIANVNTYGYKSQRAVFSDLYYQALRSASAGTASQGGKNPSAVGYGSQLAGIQTQMSQSSMQTTGYGMDVAITGEGFLQVMDPSGNIFYTKAGMLDYDANGYLTDINGNFVLGTTATGTADTQKICLSNIGTVNPKKSTVTESINGIDYTITASNPNKFGNIAISISSSEGLPDGLPAKAVISSTGAISVELNAYHKFNSMNELNTAINDAITEANGGNQHAAGKFTLTATRNMFGTEATAGTFKGVAVANKSEITLPADAFEGKLTVTKFDPEETTQIIADGSQITFTTAAVANTNPAEYTITASVNGIDYIGKVTGTSIYPVTLESAGGGSIEINTKLGQKFTQTDLDRAALQPVTGTVSAPEFFLGGAQISGVSEKFPSSSAMDFAISNLDATTHTFDLTVTIAGITYTSENPAVPGQEITLKTDNEADGSITLSIPALTTMAENYGLDINSAGFNAALNDLLNNSIDLHSYASVASKEAVTEPLTGAEIAGTDFSVTTGQMTGAVEDGFFGGGMLFMQTSTDFVGKGTVTPDKFTASYVEGVDDGNSYWTVTLDIDGKEYTTTISEGTIASSLLLKGPEGDYIQVTNPGFEGMNDYFRSQQNPPRDPATGDSVQALNGNNTIEITPSVASREMGLSSKPFTLAGGTDGGVVTLDEINSIAIASDGTITVSHGELGNVVAGRISLASFANPAGLLLQGTNYFAATANSGEPNLCDPGSDGTGSLVTSALEMSNVDLSSEFADMITTQRGFQANSRIITVSDSMLEELINLKR